jgi:hypothetical protein
MPLLNGSPSQIEPLHHQLVFGHNHDERRQLQNQSDPEAHNKRRRSSTTQISDLARSAIMHSISEHEHEHDETTPRATPDLPPTVDNIQQVDGAMEVSKVIGRASSGTFDKPSSLRRRITEERVNFASDVKEAADVKPRPVAHHGDPQTNGELVVGSPPGPGALNDTPATTAPSSPNM